MNPPGASEHALMDVVETQCFSEEALQGVYQLNRALIELLVAIASRPISAEQPPLVAHLGPALLRLGTSARERLARCPAALVDFAFRDLEFWRQVGSEQAMHPPPWSLLGSLPRSQAIQLGQTTLTLAWTLLQSNREAAAMIFGLAPECAAALGKLGLQAIPHLAEVYASCVRPRWETDVRFWRELIRVAGAFDSQPQSRLPPVSLYAMLRQFAGLVPLSSDRATCETASTRSSRR